MRYALRVRASCQPLLPRLDILDRLRAHDGEKIGFVRDAIQEIERLRKELAAANATIRKLQRSQ